MLYRDQSRPGRVSIKPNDQEKKAVILSGASGLLTSSLRVSTEGSGTAGIHVFQGLSSTSHCNKSNSLKKNTFFHLISRQVWIFYSTATHISGFSSLSVLNEREKSRLEKVFFFFSEPQILTVNAQSNDVLLSESEMAQRVRHQAVKWSWTVQNKQAGWCRSLMGTSVRTGEELRGGPSGCARENQREKEEGGEGGTRWKGIQPDLYSSFIIKAEQREQGRCLHVEQHTRQYPHPCRTKT